MYQLQNVLFQICEKMVMKKDDGTEDVDAKLYKCYFIEELQGGFTEKHLFYVSKPVQDLSLLVGKHVNVNFQLKYSQEAKIRGKKAVIVETEKVKFLSAEEVA